MSEIIDREDLVVGAVYQRPGSSSRNYLRTILRIVNDRIFYGTPDRPEGLSSMWNSISGVQKSKVYILIKEAHESVDDYEVY